MRLAGRNFTARRSEPQAAINTLDKDYKYSFKYLANSSHSFHKKGSIVCILPKEILAQL